MSAPARRPREGRPYREVTSCGGVVLDDRGRVLLLRRADQGRWCLPKGQQEDGEPPEATAVREVREEAGLVCRVLRELGAVEYEFYAPAEDVNCRKRVRYFLAEVVGGTVRPERGFDLARWCRREEALALLPYENDRRMVALAFEQLAGGASGGGRSGRRGLGR